MTKDAKHRFLSKLEKLAEELYKRGSSASHNEDWERKKSFVAGFCESGLTVSLVTREDIQITIDKAHMKVYGEARLARAERLKPIADEQEEPDWDMFDSPAYERKLADPDR